jgi:hypothetical protein
MTRHDTMTLNTTENSDQDFATRAATTRPASGLGKRVKTALARVIEASASGRAARAQRIVDGHLSFHDDKALLDMGHSAQDIHSMRKRGGR